MKLSTSWKKISQLKVLHFSFSLITYFLSALQPLRNVEHGSFTPLVFLLWEEWEENPKCVTLWLQGPATLSHSDLDSKEINLRSYEICNTLPSWEPYSVGQGQPYRFTIKQFWKQWTSLFILESFELCIVNILLFVNFLHVD